MNVVEVAAVEADVEAEEAGDPRAWGTTMQNNLTLNPIWRRTDISSCR